MLDKNKGIFLGSLVLYLGLAWGGLFYGLPDSAHSLSYNCDETTWLETLSRLKPAERQFNPHPQLGHPTAYLWAYAGSVFAGAKTGWIPLHQDKEWFRIHPEVFGRIYLAGRFLQVLFGVFFLWLLWSGLRKVFDDNVAAMTTLLFAVSPAFVSTSHFSQANMLVALLCNVSLMCLMEGAAEKEPPLPWFYAACLWAGLAVSTKLSALALAAPLAYYFFRYHRAVRPALGGAAAVAGGFVIGTPFAVIAPHSFIQGIRHHAADNQLPISNWLNALVFPIQVPFRFSLGTPLLIAALIAVVYFAVKKKTPATALLFVWIAGFFAATLRVGEIATGTRILPMLPALIILVALLLKEFPKVRIAALVVLAGSGIFYSLAIDQFRHETPLQKVSSEWIKANIPYDKTIGIPRNPYWYSPDIVLNSFHHPERATERYPLVKLNYSVEAANVAKPDYIVLTELERLRCSQWDPAAVNCMDFVTWLDSGADYELEKKFSRRVAFMGVEWKRPEYEQYPMYDDHDLWSTSVFVYRRKSAGTKA